MRVLDADPRAHSTRRHLAFLPEDSPFPEELSAESVLALIGSFAGMSRRPRVERSRELLGCIGLDEVARSPLKRYSRGMLRRFGLAQAFLTDPEPVLLDEPSHRVPHRTVTWRSRVLRRCRPFDESPPLEGPVRDVRGPDSA